MLLNYFFEEVKYRCVFILISFLSCFCVAYYYSIEFLVILTNPLLAKALNGSSYNTFIFTNVSDVFMTNLDIALLFGTLSAFFMSLINLYLFLIPGLYGFEKRKLKAFLNAFCFFFVIINCLCFHIFIPTIWAFFLGFEVSAQTSSFELNFEGRINEYISLLTHLLLVFNILLQIPLVLYFSLIVFEKPLKFFKKIRKILYFGILVLAGCFSPPDIYSMLFLFSFLFFIIEFLFFYCYIRHFYKICPN